MSVSVTILCDNLAGAPLFVAEHGFSALVDVEGRKLLFDVGRKMATLTNAALLKADLKSVEALIISHGHYDHTGGLEDVLRTIGKKRLIIHPDAFGSKYMKNDFIDLYVGMTIRKELLYSLAEIDLRNEPVEVIPGVFTSGEVARKTDYEIGDSSMKIKTDSGFETDELKDDMSIAVKTQKGLVVIMGCAHAGMINTLFQLRDVTGEERIRAVIGGSHLGFLQPDQLEKSISALKEINPERVVLSHCTGPYAAARIYNEFPTSFLFSSTGMTISFD